METKEIITLSVACVGAVTGVCGLGLSIYNTWKANSKDKTKVKLEVDTEIARGKFSVPTLTGTITNLSGFAVTIGEISLHDHEGKLVEDLHPHYLPVRLESRTSFNFYYLPVIKREDKPVWELIVKTQCGTILKDQRNTVEVMDKIYKKRFS